MAKAKGDGPLRVAQVIGSFERGGAERQAYNLVLGLRDLGADSRGIALRHAGDFVVAGGVEDHFDALEARKDRRTSIVRAGLRLRRLMARWRPHVLHVHGTESLPFVELFVRGSRHVPRLVFTWQDSGMVLHQTGTARRRMLRALSKCGRVFASSSDVASRLAEAACLERVDVFHGGVPEEPAADPATPPEILWLGRFAPNKGPERLIEAARMLHADGLSFRARLVGGSKRGSGYLDSVRARMAEQHLDGVVDLPGYVEEVDLEPYFARASIGVQTSYTEGLSMVLLEQMMRGMAIVATDVGDTAEAFQGGRCGILIDRDASDEVLAEQIRRLLADPDLRADFGRRARAHALDMYTVDAMSRRALAIYEAQVRDRRSSVRAT